MSKGRTRSYRGLLSTPIFRPELLGAMFFWNNDQNKDLLANLLTTNKILAEFRRNEEDSHLAQMAVHLGIVKRSGGIWPQPVWHEGWQRDLTLALAMRVFPEFSPVPPKKRGVKKGQAGTDTDSFELAKAVLELKQRRRMTVLSACTHLADKTGSPWKGKKAINLKAKFERFLKAMGSKNELATKFERVATFAREWLERN
jgi:hypothetical protein